MIFTNIVQIILNNEANRYFLSILGSSNISGGKQSIVTMINRIIAMNNRRCDAGRPWKNGEPAQAL
jgi:hypothetical protein